MVEILRTLLASVAIALVTLVLILVISWAVVVFDMQYFP